MASGAVIQHHQPDRVADNDLRQLDKPTRGRIVEGLLADLAPTPPPDNTDVKPLRGAEPWMRLRIGTYRILFRALTAKELERLVAVLPKAGRPSEGYLVERIVHRRDLDRAVDTL